MPLRTVAFIVYSCRPQRCLVNAIMRHCYAAPANEAPVDGRAVSLQLFRMKGIILEVRTLARLWEAQSSSLPFPPALPFAAFSLFHPIAFSLSVKIGCE